MKPLRARSGAEILVDGEYLIDVTPRHPITGPRMCRVEGFSDDGRQIAVTWVEIDNAEPMKGPAIERPKSAVVSARQVIRSKAEQQEVVTRELAGIARWKDYPEHVRRAAEAQRQVDAAARERGPRPFPSRRFGRAVAA